MRFAHLAALGSSAILLASAVTGCSDSTPVPQKGGYSVEFDKTGLACPIQSHNAAVGSGTGTVSSSDASAVATDGTDGAGVDCTVSGTGTFSVEAAATSPGNVLRVQIDAISTKNTTSNPAKGSAVFASQNTANAYSSPPSKPCTFWFEDNTKETVDTGRIWASFACEEVDSGMNSCGLTNGTIVFYNCATTQAPSQ